MAEHSKAGPPDKSTRSKTIRDVARYSQIGYTLVGSVFLGIGAGYLVDKWLDTYPLFFVLGAVLGIVVGLYHFLVTVLRK
jgi:F0F1-type ATP synthase assembly protein I